MISSVLLGFIVGLGFGFDQTIPFWPTLIVCVVLIGVNEIWAWKRIHRDTKGEKKV